MQAGKDLLRQGIKKLISRRDAEAQRVTENNQDSLCVPAPLREKKSGYAGQVQKQLANGRKRRSNERDDKF